jgi:hypothetical protein
MKSAGKDDSTDWPYVQQQQKENAMSKRDWIEVTASLIGGAGIGAAIMYFFDPDLGDRRRADCYDATGEALSHAGERMGHAWETMSHGARDAGAGAADTAHDWMGRAKKFFSRAGSAASDYVDDAGDSARSWGRSAARSARDYARGAGKSASGWLGWARRDEGPSAGKIVGITAGTVGALALGAGLMFLMDPAQGRRRRALVRDKAVSAANQTGRYVSRTSRHLSNKAHGLAAEARGLAQKAREKVTGGAWSSSALGQSEQSGSGQGRATDSRTESSASA